MSDAVKLLIYCGGLLLVTTPFTIVGWKLAGRDADRVLSKFDPPAGLALDDTGRRWLRAQLIRRLRWSIVATEMAIVVTAPAWFAFRDVAVVHEVASMVGVVAVCIGYSIGGTLATVRSARVNVGERRSAALTPRSVGTYLRSWERVLYLGHVFVAAISVLAVACLWLSNRIDRGDATMYATLGVLWTATVVGIGMLQRSVLRAHPVVHEDLYTARELMVSFAIRSLLLFQLQVVAIIAFVFATYVWLTVDGVAWTLTIAPLYGVGAVGGAIALARHVRRENGHPAPEWHFARSEREGVA